MGIIKIKILLDADSCPKIVRDLILKRALKSGIKLIFAANRLIPGCEGAQMEICPETDNSADDRIVELAEKNDIIITRDVPLAKRLIDKGSDVIDDRGRIFNVNNINEMLSLRNFTVGLADNGFDIERIKNYNKKDLKAFADSFDKLLTRNFKRK